VFIVNIEGSDPFIAEDRGAIDRGLDDLHKGKGEVIDAMANDYEVRIIYRVPLKDGEFQELNVIAYESEYYT
jgi:hypothetical protein